MKTRMWMALTGGVVALLALVVLAQVAGAQTPPGRPNPGPGYSTMPRNGTGPMSGAGMMGASADSLLAVVAEQVQMTQADLVAVLQTGKTMAQVAADHNVAVATIVDAFIAPRAAQLAQRVANGQLTQAQADTMLAAMRTNITARLNQPWTAQGAGMGTGFMDEDGDGTCDHAAAGNMGGMMGRGRR
jgi:hypothetical protein